MGQVRTDIKHTPVQVSIINVSSSIDGDGGHRENYRATDNDIAADNGVAAAGDDRLVDDWNRSSVTLSLQLGGGVVELHLTKSKTTQSWRGKVFVAERGRVRRWLPRSSKDVSYVC